MYSIGHSVIFFILKFMTFQFEAEFSKYRKLHISLTQESSAFIQKTCFEWEWSWELDAPFFEAYSSFRNFCFIRKIKNKILFLEALVVVWKGYPCYKTITADSKMSRPPMPFVGDYKGAGRHHKGQVNKGRRQKTEAALSVSYFRDRHSIDLNTRKWGTRWVKRKYERDEEDQCEVS